MSTREEEIKVKVTGADQSERDLDKVGDAAKGVGADVAVMGKESVTAGKKVDELGDEARGAASDLSRLDRQIVETRAAMAALNAEFERTGDAKVSEQFDKQTAALGRLEARARTVAKINKQISDDAKRSAKRDLEEVERLARVATGNRRDSRGILRNTLGDLAGLGAGAAGTVASGAADVAGKIPGGKLAIGALGVSAAPAIGGAIGGAALAGGALAGVGLGVAGAIANNPAPFQKAWTEAIEDVSNRWQRASVGFEKPTLAAFAIIKKAVDDIDIEGPLKEASKYVEPLARGIGGFLTAFGNGVGTLIEKAGPVIAVLEKSLPALGQAFEQAFDDIGGSADGAAMALEDIIAVIGTAVLTVGKLVGAMSDVYEWSQGVFGSDEKVISFGRALDGTAESTDSLGRSAADAARDMKSLLDQWDKYSGIAVDSTEAALALEEAQDKLVEGWHKGAGALDIANQKGQENVHLAIDAIKAAQGVRDAAIAAGDQSVVSQGKANAAYQTTLKSIEDMLVKLGLTREEAHRFVQQYDGREVTMTVVVNVDYQERLPKGISLGNLQHHASGGKASRGWSVVGEYGPEIEWMDGGENLTPAQQTRAMLGGGGGGGTAGSSATSVGVAIMPGADSYVGQLIQKLFDAGMIQVFANGQLVTTRP